MPWSHRSPAAAVVAAALLAGPLVRADETCNSPYIANLIKGQEDYVYVWTLGVEGLGDGSDKLVTVDVDPKSTSYGKVISQVSVGTRGEAHHMGFTDDRRRIWAGGLAGSDIYVFDIATDPGRPKLVKTITDLADKTGFIGRTLTSRCRAGCSSRRSPTTRTRAA
jgi:selenium-binding protein 1